MIEKPLSKVTPGRPPTDLRDRVLRAAASAAPERRRDRRDLSRFDLGLAATLALLLLGHAVLSLIPPHFGETPVVAHSSQPIAPQEQPLTLDAELVGIRIEAAMPTPDHGPLTPETVLRTTS